MQEQVSALIGKTSDASKKVYSASMYIPNMALALTGDVIVSAKELVFALTEVKFELSLWSYFKHLFFVCRKLVSRIGNIFPNANFH